jgi:hypothetical protein
MVVLEALNALYGDCLILRYADGQGQRRVWIVDGGPRSTKVNGVAVSVWRDVLLPRLKQIDPARPFVVDLGMVSHIDDDHINGIERLTADIAAALPHPGDVRFRRFWFNSFDALVGPAPAGLGESSGAMALELANPTAGLLPAGALGDDSAAVVQSVPQGIKLATNLRALGLDGNAPVNGFISARPDRGPVLIDGVSVTLIGPIQSRLDKLREEWRKALEKPTKPARTAALEALFATRGQFDSSVPNLSSIVVLVEIDGKSLLLTGDARGDDIVSAWKDLGLPDSRRVIDVLKVPHHGSFANSSEEFVRFFTASHYVFSADGHFDNPDPPVLEGLVSVHGQRSVTLHFTNADITWSKPYTLERGGAKVQTLKDMLAALRAAYPGPWQSNTRAPDRLSVEVTL